jgi:hypothetical protein
MSLATKRFDDGKPPTSAGPGDRNRVRVLGNNKSEQKP